MNSFSQLLHQKTIKNLFLAHNNTIKMKNTNLLLSKNIFWKKHPRNERYYYTKDNGKIIFLRINNFPDEPLYTLINDLDIIDIEDKPVGWNMESR